MKERQCHFCGDHVPYGVPQYVVSGQAVFLCYACWEEHVGTGDEEVEDEDWRDDV